MCGWGILDFNDCGVVGGWRGQALGGRHMVFLAVQLQHLQIHPFITLELFKWTSKISPTPASPWPKSNPPPSPLMRTGSLKAALLVMAVCFLCKYHGIRGNPKKVVSVWRVLEIWELVYIHTFIVVCTHVYSHSRMYTRTEDVRFS